MSMSSTSAATRAAPPAGAAAPFGPSTFGARFYADGALARLLEASSGVRRSVPIAPDQALDEGPGLCLRMAGIRLAVHGLAPGQVREIEDRFADDVVADPAWSAAERTWTLRFHPAPAPWFHTLEQASAGEGFWEYFLDLDPTEDHVRFAGLDIFGLLHRPPARHLDVWSPGPTGDRLERAIHNLMRIVAAFAAADLGGLLLHSAAFAAGEAGAVVCPGASGAGKSTLSAMALDLGWDVLSDELNLVWPGDSSDDTTAEQVPFTGDLGRLRRRPGLVPLAAVLPLVRTGLDERATLGVGDYYARILAEAVFVNCDPWSAPRLEENVERLLTWALGHGPLEAASFTLGGRLDAFAELLESES